MYSTRPTLPTDKQAHVKRDELPNPMCRRNMLICVSAYIIFYFLSFFFFFYSFLFSWYFLWMRSDSNKDDDDDDNVEVYHSIEFLWY